MYFFIAGNTKPLEIYAVFVFWLSFDVNYYTSLSELFYKTFLICYTMLQLTMKKGGL